MARSLINGPRQAFTAIVLAADRISPDPVALAAGAACKALVPVGGQPMLMRVLHALAAADEVDATILCGPPEHIITQVPNLQQQLASGAVSWMPPRNTPSSSAEGVLQTIPDEKPVLLTTADHALLNAALVDYFCRAARQTGCDIVAGLASLAEIKAAYPGMRRTATRFKDGPFCACNLFAFLTPRSRAAAAIWRQVEHDRKNPMKMLSRLGWWVVSKYLLGLLTLAEGLRHISRRMGFRAGAVVLPFPEAAIDVDKVSDWHFVQDLLNRDKT